MNQLVILITRQIILPLNIWLLAVIYSNAYGQTTPKLLAQKFKVSIDSLFEVQAFGGSEGLAERFTEQAAKALDSLQRELGFVFYDNFRSQAPAKSDILIKGKLYYGSPPGMEGVAEKFYTFELLLIDGYTAKQYNSSWAFTPTLDELFKKGSDEVQIFESIRGDLLVMLDIFPVDQVLKPIHNQGNLERSISLVYPENTQISPFLDTLYHLMNNVIAYKQKYGKFSDPDLLVYEYDYYPLYRLKDSQKTEAVIRATLEENEESYIVRLDIQGQNLILKSLTGGKPIPTAFAFSKTRLQAGNYLRVVQALEHTLGSFISYNYKRQ